MRAAPDTADLLEAARLMREVHRRGCVLLWDGYRTITLRALDLHADPRRLVNAEILQALHRRRRALEQLLYRMCA